MFARLMPHEGRFFTYFTEHAALILQGAIELKAMNRPSCGIRRANIGNLPRPRETGRAHCSRVRAGAD